MKSHYRIAFNIIPFGCSAITYTATISEPFENFIERNKTKYQSISVILIVPCDKSHYDTHRQFNPGTETYVKLLKRDLVFKKVEEDAD
jgi:hypothetical protein